MTKTATVGMVLVLLVLVLGMLLWAVRGRDQGPGYAAPPRPPDIPARSVGDTASRGIPDLPATHDDRPELPPSVTRQAPALPVRPAPAVPPGVADVEPALEARPPWMNEDGSLVVESAGDSEVRRLAQEIQRASGPFATEHAQGMLEAEHPGVGVVGAALMLSQPVWDEELMHRVATHDDPAVPLFAMQGLQDAGRLAEAAVLRELLRERLAHQSDWESLAVAGGLPGTAVRGLLELAAELASEQERVGLALALVGDEALDYTGRMRAVLEFRQLLPFEAYRAAVRDEYARAREAGEPVWEEGLKRLADRLEGPVEVHAGIPFITPPEVDVMTAREYPAMYEDLALHLEMLASDDTAVIGTGTIKRLQDVITTATAYPLTDSEAAALQRIAALLPQIVERDASALALPRPPGM